MTANGKAAPLVKIVGLVRWMYDKQIPLDLDWVNRYEVTPVETPLTTPGISVRSGSVQLYGGVEFPAENTYVPDDAATAELSRVARAARLSATKHTWAFQHEGKAFVAVALNLAPAEIVGGYTTTWTDAYVPLASGLAADFTRQYNSLDPVPGPLGRGWTHVVPTLTFRRAAVPENPRAFYTKAVLTAGTSRSTFIMDTEGFFQPEDPSEPYKLLGLTGDDRFDPRGVPALEFMPARPGRPFEIRDGEGNILEYQGFAVLGKEGYVLAFDPIGRLTGARSPAGSEVTYTYEADRLTAITDAAGRGIRLAYDAGGHVAELTISDGEAVRYTYDARSDLVGVFDAGGAQQAGYAYDAGGRLARITDGEGQIVLDNTYDALGRVTSTRSGQGDTWHVTFDDALNTVTYTDDAGRTVTRQYDDRNRLAAESDPWGNKTTFQYDAQDHPTRITDPNGHTTVFNYDQHSLLTEIISPLGDRTRLLHYNVYGLPEVVIDPADRLTLFQYDTQGRLTQKQTGLQLKEMTPDGRFSYLEVDPLTVLYTYDAAGNLTAVQDPAGFTTRFTYDEVGNLLDVRLPGSGAHTLDVSSRLDVEDRGFEDEIVTVPDTTKSLTIWILLGVLGLGLAIIGLVRVVVARWRR